MLKKFFWKKPIYIILIVVFTVIMAATTVIHFVLPGSSSIGTQDGFDIESMFGEFDTDSLPDGFDIGSILENIDIGSLIEKFNDGDMPGDFDMESLPQSTASVGILSIIINFWIPILIVCLIVDGACILMLVLIVKKDKKQPSKSKIKS